MPATAPAAVQDFIDRILEGLPGLRAWAEPGAAGQWWVETRGPDSAVSWSPADGFGFYDVDGEEPRVRFSVPLDAARHAAWVMGRRTLPA